MPTRTTRIAAISDLVDDGRIPSKSEYADAAASIVHVGEVET